ncbi:MAG: rod shape-determining protein RodA [Acidimicrobiales bacterium]|nr:MAG: rod shape-determining protein RodA [Acidimicrobiales bacterium]
MAQRALERRRSSWRSLASHVDVVLVASTVVVAGLGVLMVYSATQAKLASSGVDPLFYLKRQATYAAIGVVAMVAVTLVDYHRFEELGAVAYGGMVLALLAVLSPIGSSARGSQRWFQLGSFQLQPSSFASLVLIVAVAAYAHRHQGAQDLRRLGVLLAMGCLLILLVYGQPDLGTAIIMSVVLLAMLVAAGARGRHLAILGAVAVVGIIAIVNLGVLHKYQTDRLTCFVNPVGQSQGACYNLGQSQIAIGSGGVSGKGLFHGSVTNAAIVPEQQTDFIFTAVGEQLGFFGSASVLALFSLIVWRILRNAQLARDRLGRLLCMGVLGLIAFSVFQNAGMTMGIMPITGIPLPFMSYGGSAIIAFFMAVGIVLNVGLRRYR